jgi:hypothetical protein
MEELGLLREELKGLSWTVSPCPLGQLLPSHAKPGESGRPPLPVEQLKRPRRMLQTGEAGQGHRMPQEREPFDTAPLPPKERTVRSEAVVARSTRLTEGPARSRGATPAKPPRISDERKRVLQESAKRYLRWLEAPTPSYQPNWSKLRQAWEQGYLEHEPLPKQPQ